MLDGVGSESSEEANGFERAQANKIAAGSQSESDAMSGISDEPQKGRGVTEGQSGAGLREVEVGERDAGLQLTAVYEQGVGGDDDAAEGIAGEGKCAEKNREERRAGHEGGEEKVIAGEKIDGGKSGGGGSEGEGESLAPIVASGEGGEFEDGVHF
jgi:hypothetical protein